MAEKRRLFIYDRKEVGILILLGIGVALFAFTLGVHLGKQVIPKAETVATTEEVEPHAIEAAPALPPNRNEVAAEVRDVPAAVESTLDESLRDEVAETGLRVDQSKALRLPEKTRAETLKTTAIETEVIAPTKSASAKTPKAVKPPKLAVTSKTAKARYVLQVGSFPTLQEAEPQLLQLNEKGLRGEVREVEIRGKGKWFRVVLGNYASIPEAEKAGKIYQGEQRIGDFVVVSGTISAAGKN